MDRFYNQVALVTGGAGSIAFLAQTMPDIYPDKPSLQTEICHTIIL